MALDLRQNFVYIQYLEYKWTEFNKLYICIHIEKIYFGIVTHHFLPFVPERVMALDSAKISFPFDILRTNGQNFTKFYICIHIDKIYHGIVTHQFFAHFC